MQENKEIKEDYSLHWLIIKVFFDPKRVSQNQSRGKPEVVSVQTSRESWCYRTYLILQSALVTLQSKSSKTLVILPIVVLTSAFPKQTNQIYENEIRKSAGFSESRRLGSLVEFWLIQVPHGPLDHGTIHLKVERILRPLCRSKSHWVWTWFSPWNQDPKSLLNMPCFVM